MKYRKSNKIFWIRGLYSYQDTHPDLLSEQCGSLSLTSPLCQHTKLEYWSINRTDMIIIKRSGTKKSKTMRMRISSETLISSTQEYLLSMRIDWRDIKD